MNNEKGITLIVLVVTIIVMLILVAVTIHLSIDGGLFGYAKKAVKETNEAYLSEPELSSGKVNISGQNYSSVNEYVDELMQ